MRAVPVPTLLGNEPDTSMPVNAPAATDANALSRLTEALVQPGIIIEERHGELFGLPQINLRQVLRDQIEDHRR